LDEEGLGVWEAVIAEADEIERVDAGIVGLVVAVDSGEEAELDALAFEDGVRWAVMTWPRRRVTMTAPPNRRRWMEAAKPTVVVCSGAQRGCEVNAGEAVSRHRATGDGQGYGEMDSTA
jgi:hypothetical protein